MGLRTHCCAASRRAPAARARAQVRPDGLLWVWAEGGPAAAAEAAATPVVAVKELDDPDANLYLSGWFMRDVPCAPGPALARPLAPVCRAPAYNCPADSCATSRARPALGLPGCLRPVAVGVAHPAASPCRLSWQLHGRPCARAASAGHHGVMR